MMQVNTFINYKTVKAVTKYFARAVVRTYGAGDLLK